VARQSAQPKWTELAVGMAVVVPGSARENKTGDWRSQRPVWDLSKCIKCGMCEIFCPEGCIQPGPDSYPKVDYFFCKGCGICSRECWTSCISTVDEEA